MISVAPAGAGLFACPETPGFASLAQGYLPIAASRLTADYFTPSQGAGRLHRIIPARGSDPCGSFAIFTRRLNSAGAGRRRQGSAEFLFRRQGAATHRESQGPSYLPNPEKFGRIIWMSGSDGDGKSYEEEEEVAQAFRRGRSNYRMLSGL